jgi:hypothetical protein
MWDPAQRGHRRAGKERPPSAKCDAKNAENLDFSREIDPLRQLIWRAEGGWRSGKCLTVYALLAFRQLATLAERVGFVLEPFFTKEWRPSEIEPVKG